MHQAKQKCILIADDDRDVAELLAARCRVLGLEVETAHDSVSVLNRIKQKSFDVVCLDVNMPNGNALNVCEMMATEESWASIPVIILTGRQDPDTIKRCHRLCAYYVLKCSDLWARIEPLLCELLDVERTTAGGSER